MQDNDQGWVKIHRVILNKPIWQCSTAEQKTILITLLLMANHEHREWQWKGKNFMVNPGQFITSLDGIVKTCGKGISVQNVRSALKRFEKFGFLTCRTTSTCTLITIVNWDLYQKDESYDDKGSDNKITKSSQTANKEVTTNKNDKNDKECKEIYSENPELNNSLHEFIEMRETIKRPLTKRGSELVLKELNKLSHCDDEKIEILNQSILNSWQGLFPLKKEIKMKRSYEDLILA